MLTEAERTAALNDLAETSEAFLRTIESFPEEHFFTCPAEGCWSAAQTMEHVIAVEGRALGRVKAAIQEAADPARRTVFEGKDDELWNGVRARTNRVQAPHLLHPTGGKSREELIQAFHAARNATVPFASETTADLRSHFAPHPLFGDLDCYQWLRLIPAHGERHRAQIEEVEQAVSPA